MIEWWWLLVEAAVLFGYAAALRGWSRNEALAYALTAQGLAQQRLDKLPASYRLKLNRSVTARLMKQGKDSLKRNEQVIRHLDSLLQKPKDR